MHYQFTFTKQKATNKSKVLRSAKNCRSPACNLFHVALLALEVAPIFWKIYGLLQNVTFVSMCSIYIHKYINTYIYIYIYIWISLTHHIAKLATGHEMSHLTPYMTNIQSIVNGTQFKNHNYIHTKIQFTTVKLVSKIIL
jgi:hypothetical protein